MSSEKSILKKKLIENYFKIFEKELIDEIIEVGSFQSLKAGEQLIDIGDEMTHIPLIVDGVIKIIREDENGEEIALYFLEKGNTCAISFVNCINRTKSMFRGVVTRDTESIFIPVNKVDMWLQKYESWRRFIIDSYHFRLIEMVESIDRLAFLNVEKRLYKYLIDKSNIMKDKTLIITHQEIAEDNHTSRVVVSRLLKRLENDGQITIRRNRIIIEK
ncbi:MAG: Crp/Fnr family transcriptional regulator [Flavobacteriaceae bacterium]